MHVGTVWYPIIFNEKIDFILTRCFCFHLPFTSPYTLVYCIIAMALSTHSILDYLKPDQHFSPGFLRELEQKLSDCCIQPGPWCAVIPKICMANGVPDPDRLMRSQLPNIFRDFPDTYLRESFETYGFILGDDAISAFRACLMTMCGYRCEHLWCRKIPKILKRACTVYGHVRRDDIMWVCECFQNYINYDPSDGWYKFDAYTNCMIEYRYHYKTNTLADLASDVLISTVSAILEEELIQNNILSRCSNCNSLTNKVDDDGMCFFGCNNGEWVDDFVCCTSCGSDTANYENGDQLCQDCEMEL